jgi:hypothetical protein
MSDAALAITHVVEGLVSENGSALAQASADVVGIELQLRRGRPLEQLVRTLDESDVALIVLGARGTPAGRRPAGRRALELITRGSPSSSRGKISGVQRLTFASPMRSWICLSKSVIIGSGSAMPPYTPLSEIVPPRRTMSIAR